jgi:dephospho-CoA kinase
MRVALTGGIATGKSHCLRAFAALGVPTFDADQLARQAVLPGTDGFQAVIARFGAGLVRADGSLDRAALGRIVFADAVARRDLEAIVHPRVYAALAAPVGAGLSVADIPLLYETGHEGEFARVVVAACRPDQQLARVMARDGLTDEEARERLASQWPIAQKAARADFLIDTSGSVEATDRQVVEVFERLRAESLDLRPDRDA